jgi:hypothetical protein
VTKEVYYKKVGRKYVAVSEYDSNLHVAMGKGKHLIVSVDPGMTSYHYNIDPAFAPVLAAAKYGEDTLSKSIMKASELRRREREGQKLTDEQRQAWEQLVEVFGDEAKQLEWPSARGAAEEVMQKLAEEADKMLKVPSVKLAYEQFMMVYKLTKDEQDDTES